MRQLAWMGGVVGWSRWRTRQRRHGGRAAPSRAVATVVLAMLALSLSLCCAAGASAAGRPPGGTLTDPVVREADVDAPAVVRVATLYTAHITLALCGQAVTLPASPPAGYTLGGLGTGAFVSAQGDVLTADHVINIAKADLDNEIMQYPTSAGDIAAAVNAAAACLQLAFPITASDVASNFLQLAGIAYTTSYSPPRYLVWQDVSYTGPLPSGSPDATQIAALLSAQPLEATLTASSDFSQDDIALLHVSLQDTPSISLDSSSAVAAGDQLVVIGFPGNGDVTSDPTNLLTPSINDVMVSAIKRNDDGAALLQVGGNVEHGDSGGPALDSAGHIVGVVSFGGTDVPGITAFLRSSDSAQAVMSGAHISDAPGTFELLWQQAFADYAASYAGHWHRAAQELTDLSAKYPAFHGVNVYEQYAQIAEAQETLPSSSILRPGTGLIAAVAGGAGLLLLVLVVILVLLLRRRGHAARARAAAAAVAPDLAALRAPAYAAPGPYGYPPAYPPPYGPYYQPGPHPASSVSLEAGDATPAPEMSRAPGPRAEAASETATAPAEAGICLRGHVVPPGALRCGLCGAPRR